MENRVAMMLSVLANGRKLKPFVILKRIFQRKNFLVESYFNVMRMGG
jgi:hypothetical protein